VSKPQEEQSRSTGGGRSERRPSWRKLRPAMDIYIMIVSSNG
jgi:hypothetical protein